LCAATGALRAVAEQGAGCAVPAPRTATLHCHPAIGPACHIQCHSQQAFPACLPPCSALAQTVKFPTRPPPSTHWPPSLPAALPCRRHCHALPGHPHQD
jgi:hypothetical protein